MPDLQLVCQNCHNQFIYSEYEQQQHNQQGLPQPIYCPICTAIKNQEKLRPPKPKPSA